MYVVYALVDPTNNKVRYVGMTSDVYTRFVQHISLTSNNREKNQWIDSLKIQGIIPILKTLEIVYTLSDARIREVYWINHYTHLGMPLTNIIQYCTGSRKETPSTQELKKAQTNEEERAAILGAARAQLKQNGKVIRTHVRDALGWNNANFPKIKQVLDEEGL